MEDENNFAIFYGEGYQGEVRFSVGAFRFELTDLKNRNIYRFQADDEMLMARPKEYFFFNNTEKLMQEIVENDKIEITDEGVMIIPVEVIYRGNR